MLNTLTRIKNRFGRNRHSSDAYPYTTPKFVMPALLDCPLFYVGENDSMTIGRYCTSKRVKLGH